MTAPLASAPTLKPADLVAAGITTSTPSASELRSAAAAQQRGASRASGTTKVLIGLTAIAGVASAATGTLLLDDALPTFARSILEPATVSGMCATVLGGVAALNSSVTANSRAALAATLLSAAEATRET